MPINQNEANEIANRIEPIFDQVLDEYDFRKYPANDYQRFRTSFSALNNLNPDIEDALIWKWGHWGKANFPQHHRDLTEEIQGLWPQFITNCNGNISVKTFEWWSAQLANRTRYITVAYITHLVHHNEPLPIIDQHNFRAMNALIACLRPERRAKKKPSNWNDIATLKSFVQLVRNSIPNRSFGELDRFLMMYGRNYVDR
ncbi:hypothetical protein [uncultured Spongiibacter sp.]|uniref:hypothetical protein n=1 Tax=uncultured Spongiibacter sp. TaxID=870896 RepID=UPI002591DC27|nr:hypothetical protein [uncultured Spongiibacter sp.]